MKTEIIVPDDVLGSSELDEVSDAIVEYITNKTGFCVNTLSYNLQVTYELDKTETLGDD